MSNKSTWVIGRHAVSAVLNTEPHRGLELWFVNNPRNTELPALLATAARHGVSCHPVEKKVINKKTGSDNHQGIALRAQPKREGNQEQLLSLLRSALDQGRQPLILVLDQVQDPHNFGACLRTADAAGVDAVVVSSTKTSPITPVVQKVASGAVETVNLYRVANLSRALIEMQKLGVWIIGTSDKAEASLYDSQLKGPLALVMGAEGKGLRALTMKHCDQLVKLPMSGSVVSSLNLSVATGVCLFEAKRRRTTTSG